MEVFHCESSADTRIPLYSGPCFSEKRPYKTQVCKKVMAAWAMGAAPFVYPEVMKLNQKKMSTRYMYLPTTLDPFPIRSIRYRISTVLIIIIIWSILFIFPWQEAGLPIGGPDFNSYIMLEVHYNNPGLRKGNVSIYFLPTTPRLNVLL